MAEINMLHVDFEQIQFEGDYLTLGGLITAIKMFHEAAPKADYVVVKVPEKE